MPEEIKVYRVPEHNLPKLKERIAKLAKRAAKLKVGEVVLNVLGFEDKEYSRRDGGVFEDGSEVGVKEIRRIYNVTVSGPAPKINGWQFAAVLQPVVGEDGAPIGSNLLRVVPGTEFPIPEKYRNAGNNCDHCKTIRRRNETFVLRSEAGEFKQVGRLCLRDFLGHQSPETYAQWAEILLSAADFASLSESDAEFGGVGSNGAQRFAAEEILKLTAACVRLYGWRSNKTAREFGSQSTSAAVSEWIFSKKEARDKWEKKLIPNEDDEQVAKEVVEWLASLSERPDLNDYMYNLSVLGQGATFIPKNFGLACSAIPTYLKEKEREINRRKRFEADVNSQYVGAVDEKLTFTATVVYATKFENDFGVTHFYKMKDADGNVIVYFSSKEIGIGSKVLETGDTVSLAGKVKKQEERDGVKQTVVTRCKPALSKKTEKAIKILTHAQRKGVYGGMAEILTCEVNGYNHNYNPQLCKAPHPIEWSDSALYGTEGWHAANEASKCLQSMIDQFTEEAIVKATKEAIAS